MKNLAEFVTLKEKYHFLLLWMNSDDQATHTNYRVKQETYFLIVNTLSSSGVYNTSYRPANASCFLFEAVPINFTLGICLTNCPIAVPWNSHRERGVDKERESTCLIIFQIIRGKINEQANKIFSTYFVHHVMSLCGSKKSRLCLHKWSGFCSKVAEMCQMINCEELIFSKGLTVSIN